MSVRATVCVLLVVANLLVFIQTVNHGFVNIDDQTYICHNKNVAPGLTFDGFVWAFSHCYASNWHPLTWLSHMLDCQFFGMSPGGHHLTSLALHILTSVLLLRFLYRATGCFWPSALSTALFAIHPLRAESVAWAAERKDVLSGFLAVVTMNFYFAYTQRSSWGLYAAVIVTFALGLAAKPMLVTLPFVMLLFDWWPLRRWGRQLLGETLTSDKPARGTVPWKLLIEKLPLLLLSAASCAITSFAQRQSMSTLTKVDFTARLSNCAISMSAYILQFLVPRSLAAFYPWPTSNYPALLIVAAAAMLLTVSAIVFALRRRFPFLLVGWLWYVGTLVPVLGLVQVGSQTRADRYTYIPQIGLDLMLAWTAAAYVRWRPDSRRFIAPAAGILLACLGALAWRQTSTWRNDETLWTQAISSTSQNHLAHYNLGVALQEMGHNDLAEKEYRAAIHDRPDYSIAYNNLGRLLDANGRRDQAIDCFLRAIALDGELVEAESNLGNALRLKGDLANAARHLNRAIEVRSDYAEAYVNLALVRQQQGDAKGAAKLCQTALELNPQFAEAHLLLGHLATARGDLKDAEEHFRQAVRSNPRMADAYFSLGSALVQQGRSGDALPFLRTGLTLQPNDVRALEMTARLLATDSDPLVRKGDEAVVLAVRATQLSGGHYPLVLETLAAAYAENGQFPLAICAATAARDAASDPKLAVEIEGRIELYRAGKAFHQRKP